MAPRSTHRTIALTIAGILAAVVLHDAVPHEGVHEALAQTHATPTPTTAPTNTPMPTATMTMTAMPTQTATSTVAATSTATATVAATSTPSGGSGTCPAHDPNAWHGAVGPNGCTYGHEHGDAPPGWVALAYNGAFNTSALENAQGPTDAMPDMRGKHTAMKGFLANTGGVDYYIRYHAASNVLDRMSRFHSFELWARETANGKVSRVSGWTNSGVPTRVGLLPQEGAGGRKNICASDPDIRPNVDVVMSLANYQSCNSTEKWYFYPIGAWQPTFSINIETTTISYVGEQQQTSMVNWIRTGSLGTDREMGLTWNPKGDPNDPLRRPGALDAPFWSTQFGEVVSGPSDPRCSGSTTFPANPTATIHPFDATETYQNVCLQQMISSTLPFVNTPLGYREYGKTGIRLPN